MKRQRAFTFVSALLDVPRGGPAPPHDANRHTHRHAPRLPGHPPSMLEYSPGVKMPRSLYVRRSKNDSHASLGVAPPAWLGAPQQVTLVGFSHQQQSQWPGKFLWSSSLSPEPEPRPDTSSVAPSVAIAVRQQQQHIMHFSHAPVGCTHFPVCRYCIPLLPNPPPGGGGGGYISWAAAGTAVAGIISRGATSTGGA